MIICPSNSASFIMELSLRGKISETISINKFVFLQMLFLPFSLFQQQCTSSLIFPDSLASVPSQFGLSIPDLDHGPGGHGGDHHGHHHHHGGHQGLTLMGVSPVVLPSGQHTADITSHQDHGDKSPLPELTQLSSHDFTRGNTSPGSKCINQVHIKLYKHFLL